MRASTVATSHNSDVSIEKEHAAAAELAALQGQKTEWERRRIELSETIARLTVECQALHSRGELERYRLQVQAADAQKRLDLAGEQIAALHERVRELLAERQVAGPVAPAAEVEQLRASLREAEAERASLRDELANSLALRMARSLAWVLAPLRKAIGGGKTGSGQ
jgi:predicted  nucleic acid-binding Zn-ribbon protein